MRRVLLTSGIVAAILVPHVLAQSSAPQKPPAPRLAATATTRTAASSAANKLPVKRVVLYKNGVGFFEHVGQVRGTQDVSIDFTTAQLNDVLKSLTTLDLGNGQITSVSYNSEDPLSRRLGALRLPLDESTSLVQFLTALRGARLEFTGAGAPIVGRLLSVDERTTTTGTGDGAARAVQGYEASVVSDAGEVRTVALKPSVGVRILDRDAASQVSRYLGLVASARDRDVRRMTIATSGTGDRQLYVSYVSEVPVWKTTYRLVVPEKPAAKATLQGWAIVDNTIGEDWDGVELSLVAGAPQSFIQQISQPYYSRRPVVPLPQAVLLEPQTHEATLQDTATNKMFIPPPAPAAQARAESGYAGGTGGAARRVEGGIAGGVAGGVVGGLTESVSAAAASPIVSDAAVETARDRLTAAAQGRDLGDLFEYKLKERVTIPKNQSAMVPVVQAGVEVEKVSLWNQASGARPLRAVWLTNSTPLTLDGGSFTVLENNTFAGEGLVQALKPGERRFLSYAVDLGVLVDTRRESDRQQVSSLQISRGVLRQRNEERERRTYTIRNEDPQPRTVVIEHPVRAGWKLMGNATPEESSAGFYRFKVPVKPKSTETFTVEELHPIDVTYRIVQMTPDTITVLLRQKSANPQVEQALQAVLAKKYEIASIGNQVNEKEGAVQVIFRDQERVRENLKALKGTASEKALLERYTRQLDDQENQLAALRKDIAALQQKQRDLQVELNRMIEGIDVQ